MTRPPAKTQIPKGGPTPAMRQFFEVKATCPDAILFFQMGDFYELFFEDAELAAPLLDLALTSRQKINDKPVPMCGVPLSAAEGYINRLVALGRKVAVCDQLSSPAPGVLAERVVKRIVTPGTLVDADGQTPNLPRILAAIGELHGMLAMAAADISTGYVVCGRFDGPESLQSALSSLEPREILLSDECPDGIRAMAEATLAMITFRPKDLFAPSMGLRMIKEVYGLSSQESPKSIDAGSLSSQDSSKSPKTGPLSSQDSAKSLEAGPLSSQESAKSTESGFAGDIPKNEVLDTDIDKIDILKNNKINDEGQNNHPSNNDFDLNETTQAKYSIPNLPNDDIPDPDGPKQNVSKGGRPDADAPEQAGPQSNVSQAVIPGVGIPEPDGPQSSVSKDAKAKTSPKDGPKDESQEREALDIIRGRPALLSVMGALLGYLKEMAKEADLSHLSEPRLLSEREALGLDEAAVRNLELFRTLSGEPSKATLLAQIDLTSTPMGARLIRDWLARPLVNRKAIEGRHEAVEFLVGDLLIRQELTKRLSEGGDLERALGRLALGRGHVRDLHSVRKTLTAAPEVKRLLMSSPARRLKRLGESMDLLEPLRRKIETTLIDSASTLKDGPVVSDGVSPVLDELRSLESGGKMEIASMEHRERRRTGISNLKIGFNKIYGYYLEVTKSNLQNVPADWMRKQTITGGERYVTEALKEWEEKVLTAGDKRQALENRILENLKNVTARNAPALKALSAILAEADALSSLAICAEAKGWTRPKLSSDDIIDIKGGRHPVVERFLPAGEPFVENDVLINDRERILIITGPNMAGKSTILRQTALIVVLCQMGSFVPAASATLSIRDQVFTRVGASDDLARGRSTFMVEMSETARILKKATPASLVILDEVGRGTSTFDGLAIAWAVAERLHDLGGRGVATLFAPHYHELVELARHKSMVRNYNVSVKRWGDTIVFLRKLAPGGVNRSYGLDVASLAGLPPQVVKRAREVLADVTKQGSGLIRPSQSRSSLLTLAGIGQDGPHALAREIAAIKAEELTPMEALSLLVELKRRALEALS